MRTDRSTFRPAVYRSKAVIYSLIFYLSIKYVYTSILFAFIAINSYLCSIKFKFNLICMVMKNFGVEANNQYLVVLNGNVVKKSFSNKKPALRWCLRYSVNKRNYVELWYQHENGFAVLCGFWN